MRGTWRIRRAQRKLKTWKSQIFDRLTQDDLVRGLCKLDIPAGSTVCVHSSLSRLGYVECGADGVVEAVLQAVGSQGRVLMPAFTMSGTMLEYLQIGAPFDVNRSPSKAGAITEAFRQRSDVLRSMHPTNSLCGWGKDVESLLVDHDKSPTPYGRNTPYGRLAERDDAYILMIETHVQSLLHHLQDRVNFPNLFLPDEMRGEMIDADGSPRHIMTRVMRPQVPYFVAIPSRHSQPDWALIQDFTLTFPERRERLLREKGYRFDGYTKLYERRKLMENAGILRATKVGSGEIGLLKAKEFIKLIEPEFREMIERFRPHYEADKIKAMNLPNF